MTNVITTAVIKGGTGKSTTCAALAQAAVAEGYRVLAVDLDPQANLSYFIGADQNRAGSYEALHGTPAAQLIQSTEQEIDALTGGPDLATERTKTATAKRLQAALEPIRERYDFIFIDTPPQMGDLTFNALQAATGLLIPLESDNGNLQGLYRITDIAHQIQESNPELQILGTILTRYDPRPKINRYLRDAIIERGQEVGAPFLLAIRPGIAIREAQGLQLSLYDYAPKSKPAQDYKELFAMITGGFDNGH